LIYTVNGIKPHDDGGESNYKQEKEQA